MSSWVDNMERVRKMDTALVKQMLLTHVRSCRSITCQTCLKLRRRMWIRSHPLHSALTPSLRPGLCSDEKVLGSKAILRHLRDGADIHQTFEMTGNDMARLGAAAPPWPTPKQTALNLAQALDAQGKAPEGSPAWLILRASEPWSPNTHHVFPAEKRGRAVELLRIGFALSRSSRFAGEEQAMMDVWREVLMPQAIA